MIKPKAPEHMTRWARNERLYRHLLSLGLVVDPVFADEARTQIDHLRVSADLPGLADAPAVAGVVMPMPGAEVGQGIRTAAGDGANVVDFPPVL